MVQSVQSPASQKKSILFLLDIYIIYFSLRCSISHLSRIFISIHSLIIFICVTTLAWSLGTFNKHYISSTSHGGSFHLLQPLYGIILFVKEGGMNVSRRKCNVKILLRDHDEQERKIMAIKFYNKMFKIFKIFQELNMYYKFKSRFMGTSN